MTINIFTVNLVSGARVKRIIINFLPSSDITVQGREREDHAVAIGTGRNFSIMDPC